jgi:hypothetical protein
MELFVVCLCWLQSSSPVVEVERGYSAYREEQLHHPTPTFYQNTNVPVLPWGGERERNREGEEKREE